MASDAGRSTTTVALIILGVLLLLWLVRFVIGVFVWLSKLLLVGGLVLAGAYVAYRLWRGWAAAGRDRERPPRP